MKYVIKLSPQIALIGAVVGLLSWRPVLAHNTNINLTPQYSSGSNPENGGAAAYGYAYGVDSQPAKLVNISATLSDPCAAGGHTGCYSDNSANGYGWYNATLPQLGDSHQISANVWDAVFYVANPKGAEVTINASNYAQTGPTAGQFSTAENPALSVYSGLIYGQSHDDVSSDPLIPVNANYATAVSPHDAAPNDPAIRSQYFDANGNSVANPDWNKRFAGIEAEGGQDPNYAASGANEAYNTANLAYLAANFPNMTPAEWYALNYTDHNGYRDTLNYTTLGGLIDAGTPSQTYNGQLDAFGNWSIGDSHDPALHSNAALAAVGYGHYIASVSNSDCTGPNCTPSYANVPGLGLLQTGGHLNSHLSHPASETLSLYLTQGWYTVWAGGNAGPANTAFYYQTVTLDINNVSAVPLPASLYLFASALIGLRLQRRQA